MNMNSNSKIKFSPTASWFDIFVLKWPQVSIVSVYIIVNILVLIPFYKLMPVILSYAPGLRQNQEIYKMTYGSTYASYYWVIIISMTLLHAIPLMLIFRPINKWKKLFLEKELSKDTICKINAIRKKCNNIPYYIILAQISLPVIGILGLSLYIFKTEYAHIHLLVNAFKLLLLFFSILGSIGIVSFLFAKRICKVILLNTDIDGSYPGFRVSFRYSLLMQMILMFIIGITITSLIGYAKLLEEKGDLLLKIYKEKLDGCFNINKKYSLEEVNNILQTIKLDDENTCYFYLGENGEEFTSDGSILYKDFRIYLKYLSHLYNGKVYIASGELQGASLKIKTDRGDYFVGIKYIVASKKMVLFFIICFISLLLLNSLVFFYFSHSISNDISLITNNLQKIAQGELVDLQKQLPVVSNDEIGDLVVAFNNIQKLVKEQIEQIKRNETILREKERLASLGQLIGGIAHNLRTPIMSLSGGLKGLESLISEYDKSIDNSSVMPGDHHAIAQEMQQWITKLQPYCAYMADVITTVKEHSIIDNANSASNFTITELIKRINILISNELKRNNCQDKYISAGAIIYNGTMKMVEDCADGDDTYEAWTLFGDPSLMPFTKTPVTLTVTAPTSIAGGTQKVNISFGTKIDGRICLYDATNKSVAGCTFVNDANSTTVDAVIPAVDKLTLVVTARNCIPYEKEITVNSSSINSQSDMAKNLKIQSYPNPFSTTTNISFRNPGKNATVSIYSSTGKQIVSSTVTGNSYTWNAENETSGLYIVRVKTNSGLLEKSMYLIK